MGKAIELIMNADKSIQVNNSGINKYIITENERKISAQKIYDILDYSPGDKYTVTEINENKIDEQVLSFFKEMFDNICTRINSVFIEEMTIKEDEPIE
jgi:hypothetical protein